MELSSSDVRPCTKLHRKLPTLGVGMFTNWANSLLDIPLDSIIDDDDFRDVSAEILEGFMKLKARNYDVYLSDAKSYGDELSRRNKEYNSLVSRMRKALKKGDAK